MAKIIEHASDDPDGPRQAGAWKTLAPDEAERLSRALQPRSFRDMLGATVATDDPVYRLGASVTVGRRRRVEQSHVTSEPDS